MNSLERIDAVLGRLRPEERQELIALCRRHAARPGGLKALLEEVRVELVLELRRRGLSASWVTLLVACLAQLEAAATAAHAA